MFSVCTTKKKKKIGKMTNKVSIIVRKKDSMIEIGKIGK